MVNGNQFTKMPLKYTEKDPVIGTVFTMIWDLQYAVYNHGRPFKMCNTAACLSIKT